MKWMYRKIRRWYNRISPAPKPVPATVDESFVTVWGQIKCHEKHKPGADLWDRTISEYVYSTVMAPLLKMFDEDRTGRGVYAAALALFKKGCTASIEAHFNAGGGYGIEILCLENDFLSAKYARKLIAKYRLIYPNRPVRGHGGIKWVSKGDPGYYNLVNAGKAGMKIKILTEFFFGDNKKDYISPEDQAEIINYVLIDAPLEVQRELDI